MVFYHVQSGARWMIKAERDRCAELVEQIRHLSLRPKANEGSFVVETWEQVDEKRDAVRELCDQLIMKLQPITVRYPKRTP